jgi:hypothetical protein
MVRDRVRGVWLRAKALFLPRALERDLQDELPFHLEMREREHRSEGFTPQEARARARQRFGNLLSVKDSTRDVWSVRALEGLLQDLKYSIRSCERRPRSRWPRSLR